MQLGTRDRFGHYNFTYVKQEARRNETWPGYLIDAVEYTTRTL